MNKTLGGLDPQSVAAYWIDPELYEVYFDETILPAMDPTIDSDPVVSALQAVGFTNISVNLYDAIKFVLI